MELSRRLQAVADLVSDGVVLADVGTDHGYIPIYLLQQGKIPRAIAMDVNKGPLQRAQEHLEAYKLDDKAETRLSDGTSALQVGECECVVIAGMGGALTIRIMENGKDIFKSLKEFILQPQSELGKVRKYLQENEYCVVAENMVYEDGKFYPMMKVVNGKTENDSEMELQYGKYLLAGKHPVLQEFLKKEASTKEQILRNLNVEAGEHIRIRYDEVQAELALIHKALACYE